MTREGGAGTFAWDPQQYLRYEAPRLRPALELLARVPLQAPQRICDLGCGAGNVTAFLHARWPAARIEAVDSSPEMIEKAREADADGYADWRIADAAVWTADPPVDLLYSNAVLHWLPDHAALFPRLMAQVAPGGCLAVQMPRNFDAPSHRLLYETAREAPWKDRLEPLIRPDPVAAPGRYFRWLAPSAAEIDIWETEYQHVLEGEDPVFEWTRGTALKPFLDALGSEDAASFAQRYKTKLRRAYPPLPDGRTLFPFRRLFIVATRSGAA